MARSLTEYRAAIAEEEEVIAWGLVFGLGVMLENAAAATKRKIEDRLLPSLEDASQSALDSLLTLHGPLILATGEGRELQEQADRLRMTREEQLRLRSDAEILALQLLRSPDLIEPEVAETVVQAIQAIGEGRFPERGTVFGFVTTKNVAIVLLSGAALAAFLSAGVALAGPLGGVATTGVAWVGYESLKKSKIFAAATTAVAEKFDQLIQDGETKLAQRLTSLAPFNGLSARTRTRCVGSGPTRGNYAGYFRISTSSPEETRRRLLQHDLAKSRARTVPECSPSASITPSMTATSPLVRVMSRLLCSSQKAVTIGYISFEPVKTQK